MTSFAYDAASQLVSVTDPMSRLTSYEYDGLGRNTKITEPDPDGAGQRGPGLERGASKVRWRAAAVRLKARVAR